MAKRGSGVCHCGIDMDQHTWQDGHNPVEMMYDDEEDE